MADGIPTDPPATRSLDWAAIVRKIWGDEWNKRETVYEFSNKRKFEDSRRGPYAGTGT